MESQRKSQDIFEEKELLVKLALCLVAQSCPTLWDPIDCSSPGSSVHGDSLGKRISRQPTWVGCHALLQGIFPTQGLNPGFPHCRRILYHLSHQGSPKLALPDIKTLYEAMVIKMLLMACACVHAQSCQTLCDPMDCSPTGSFVHGIL